MALSDGAIEDFTATCALGQAAVLRLGGYQVDFLPGGPVLVVTFEPTTHGRPEPELDRPAWGQPFLLKRGHSVLGVKRQWADWYRGAELHRAFRGFQARGLFRTFEKVVFYGPSMGGYAALAFASCAPGCTVIAMNPQSTLAPDLCWFDQRFAGDRAGRWSGDFVDGALEARAAARVYVCYDPYQVKDRLHAQRLDPANLVKLRLPFVGHTTAVALNTLGLLATVFDQAVAGTLDEAGFRQIARARAGLADYHARLAERGRSRPRRLRHLDRALAIDPGHAGARALAGALRPTAAAPAILSADERWPPGMVSAGRLPLIYLNLAKSGGTTVQNQLHYMAWGRYPAQPQDIFRNADLQRSWNTDPVVQRQFSDKIRSGAVVFTFLRDPGERAYACFNEKIFHTGPHSFLEVRRQLVEGWGLMLDDDDRGPTLPVHQANFSRFLDFVEANVAGATTIRWDAGWSPQVPQLARFRERLQVKEIGLLAGYPAQMARILHRAGVNRIPDLRKRPFWHPRAPHPYAEVVTPDIQAKLDRIYRADYALLQARLAKLTPAPALEPLLAHHHED